MRNIEVVHPNTKHVHSLSKSSGIERLLNTETNVSDFLQYLTTLDATPWGDLVGFVPIEVRREFSLRSNEYDGRGDLLLTGSCAESAAVEVKLGHQISHDQQAKYESWATTQHASLLLASLDPENELPATGWQPLWLDELFDRWGTSEVMLARELAQEIASFFRQKRRVVDGLFLAHDEPDMKSFADISTVDEMRIVTRSIRQRLEELGLHAGAGVTTKGGNALIQAWSPIAGTSLWFISEARFSRNRAVLRFGIDGPASGLEVWNAAKSIDAALRVDSLLSFAAESSHSALLECVANNGPGRPSSKGDWEAALITWDGQKDFAEHFSGLNPGFQRDKAYRLQALGVMNLERTNAALLVEMLSFTLKYLEFAWAARKL